MATWECLARKTTIRQANNEKLRAMGHRWDEGGFVHFLSSAKPPQLPAMCMKQPAAGAASSLQLPPVKTTQAVTQVLSHFLQTSSSCLAPSPSQHSKTSREKKHIWNIGWRALAVLNKNCQSKAEQLFFFLSSFQSKQYVVPLETSLEPTSKRTEKPSVFKLNLRQFIIGDVD